MLQTAVLPRAATHAPQGHLAGLRRWRPGSPGREATRKARASRTGVRAPASGAGLGGGDAVALRRGGAAAGEGRLLSASGGGRVTWARGAAAIGPRHVCRSPARDVTRGDSVKNKNKNPESKCLRPRRVAWKFPRRRADRKGARAAQPGPARPPAAPPCDSGRGARRGSAGARPHAGGAAGRAAGRRPGAARARGPPCAR